MVLAAVSGSTAVSEARRIAHSFYASPYDTGYLKQSSPLWRLLEDDEGHIAKDLGLVTGFRWGR